jgi:predicted  nucleic acid-binding Zn-ribbon protein
LHRAEKIEFMDLGQELHHVRERQLKVETNIEEYGKEMEDLRKKLKEMGSKSFFARLFRR